MTPSPVRVKIFGKEYTVKGQADEAYLQALARLVDGKMGELARPGSSADVTKVAIMAAFNIADELMKVRRDLDTERQRQAQAGKLVDDLARGLEAALAAPEPEPEPAPLASAAPQAPEADAVFVPPATAPASQPDPAFAGPDAGDGDGLVDGDLHSLLGTYPGHTGHLDEELPQ